jgi:sugar phosphate isomerase/epimerase
MSAWKVGIQLYTIRDETAKDFVGALKRVAAEGYQGVEFAGYGGLPANEMKALLDELGLQAIGSHVGIGRLTSALDEEIEYNLAIGSRYIVCPALGKEHRQDEAAWRNTFRLLEQIGDTCRERGIAFGYHNHRFEFEDQVGGEPALDALFGSVSADAVKVELDACWVHFAGYDPVAYIGKYAGRLPIVHFKDAKKKEDGQPITVELGQGEVDLHAIAKAADQAGTEWLVYEQDVCQNPPFTAMANSMRWMKENGLA